ncbi:hypothetical protein [Archaeoglobus neptunius]|uniref:hypothetical protein n=1 Tax=Archaeoglobus neptunius TaxID=2798580 RepID=UPI0019284D27|nr:hypothetical protein [Archaeoglobus neptunius]
MGDLQLDEKVKKKKADLITSLIDQKPKVEAPETRKPPERVEGEEKRPKQKRKRKLVGFTLDPVARDRLAAIAIVEEENMSQIVEGLVNQLFKEKWEEWDEDTRKFLLRKFPRILP